MKPANCQYCERGGQDLRPYGRDGAWICFSCGTLPENVSTTEEMAKKALESAMGEAIASGSMLALSDDGPKAVSVETAVKEEMIPVAVFAAPAVQKH